MRDWTFEKLCCELSRCLEDSMSGIGVWNRAVVYIFLLRVSISSDRWGAIS